MITFVIFHIFRHVKGKQQSKNYCLAEQSARFSNDKNCQIVFVHKMLTEMVTLYIK
jgi:hypothetical protein